jgi:hypothetical protein
MLANEIYLSYEEGNVSGARLHRLLPDGTWAPPVPPESWDQVPEHLKRRTTGRALPGSSGDIVRTAGAGSCKLISRSQARPRSHADRARFHEPAPNWWLGRVPSWWLSEIPP